MDKGQRICGLCGKPLSIYNTTGQCFFHAVDSAMREYETLQGMVRNPQPELVEQNVKLYTPEASEQGGIPKIHGKVLLAVAELYEITPEQILEKNRSPNLVLPRQVVMYLLNKQFGISLVEISKLLLRDHTTVLHGIRQIDERMKTDQGLKKQVESFSSLSS